jgi:hypothetical protein
MANQPQLFQQLQIIPLPPDVIGRNLKIMPLISDEVLKLQTDTINVLEGRTDIYSFNPEYQKKIRNFWQFSGTSYTSDELLVAKRNMNTFEIL